MEVDLEPVTLLNLENYISVGVQSYKEHYLHLWENQNPSPFIDAYLTKAAVKIALKDATQLFYLIMVDGRPAGILNLTLDSDGVSSVPKNNLLLNKIYILNSYSGKGIGGKTLAFVHDLAKKRQKECVWLYTMKKGKALRFYEKHGYTIKNEGVVPFSTVLEDEREMWLMQRKP